MQIVRRPLLPLPPGEGSESRNSTHSIWPPSASVDSSFSVPSPACECAGQLFAERLRQIGHLRETARPLPEQPPPHLPQSIRTLPARLEPRRELRVDRIQQMRHGNNH